MTIRHNMPPEVLAQLTPGQRAALDDPAAEALQDRVDAAYRDLIGIARHALELRIEGRHVEMMEHAGGMLDRSKAMSHEELAIIANFALADCARFARACADAGIEDIP